MPHHLYSLTDLSRFYSIRRITTLPTCATELSLLSILVLTLASINIPITVQLSYRTGTIQKTGMNLPLHSDCVSYVVSLCCQTGAARNEPAFMPLTIRLRYDQYCLD